MFLQYQDVIFGQAWSAIISGHSFPVEISETCRYAEILRPLAAVPAGLLAWTCASHSSSGFCKQQLGVEDVTPVVSPLGLDSVVHPHGKGTAV